MPIPVPGSVAEALRRQTVHLQVRSSRQRSAGSGVVIGPELVITNAHVVRGQSLIAQAWDGKDVSASCLRLDRHRDLALLSAPGLRAEPACLGASDALRAGTAVFAVGNPLGFLGALSSGVVHAVSSLAGQAWIQADVRLAPGSSGGPLADYRGHVVGINTMVMSPGVMASGSMRNGLALAVPSRAVQSFLARAKSGRSLGITVRPLELARGGLGIILLEVSPNSSAERASLLPGDILAGCDDRLFRSLDDLQFAIDTAPGAILRLDFYRGGQRQLRHVTVRLAPEQVPTAA